MLRWFLWGNGFMIVDVWTLGPLETSAGVAAEHNFEKPPPHYRISTGDRPEIECWCNVGVYPPQNKQIAPEKLPSKKGQDRLPTTGFLQGQNAPKNFRGCGGCFVMFCFFLQTAGENVQLKSLKSRLFAALERVNIDPAEFLKDDERKIRMEKAPSLVLNCFIWLPGNLRRFGSEGSEWYPSNWWFWITCWCVSQKVGEDLTNRFFQLGGKNCPSCWEITIAWYHPVSCASLQTKMVHRG